jgi:hypothetical protein
MFDLLVTLLFIPLVLLVSTPIILVKNLFGKGNYWQNVKISYKNTLKVLIKRLDWTDR